MNIKQEENKNWTKDKIELQHIHQLVCLFLKSQRFKRFKNHPDDEKRTFSYSETTCLLVSGTRTLDQQAPNVLIALITGYTRAVPLSAQESRTKTNTRTSAKVAYLVQTWGACDDPHIRETTDYPTAVDPSRWSDFEMSNWHHLSKPWNTSSCLSYTLTSLNRGTRCLEISTVNTKKNVLFTGLCEKYL